jgi:hypothetical protein
MRWKLYVDITTYDLYAKNRLFANGRAEQAVSAMAGQARVMLAALEGRLGVEIPLNLPM